MGVSNHFISRGGRAIVPRSSTSFQQRHCEGAGTGTSQNRAPPPQPSQPGAGAKSRRNMASLGFGKLPEEGHARIWPNRIWPKPHLAKKIRIWQVCFRDRIWPNRIWPELVFQSVDRIWPNRIWPIFVFQCFGQIFCCCCCFGDDIDTCVCPHEQVTR